MIKNTEGLILLVFFLQALAACGQQQDHAKAAAKAQSEYQAPDYVDTSSFSEKELVIISDSIALPATLTLPDGDGPFPAVVLVHGSGPQDRDETILANKPFRDLAWGLASKGIAVLRYDKRTRIAPYSFLNKIFTVKEEVTADALRALQLVREIEKVNPNATYLLGHSLGGALAPRIAAEDGKLKGIIVMAGTARSFEEILSEQGKYLASTDTSPAMQFQRALLDTLSAKIRRLTSKDSVNPSLIAGAPAAYYLDFRKENPPERAASLGINILVLQGKRDYQVTMEDFAMWQSALSNQRLARLKTYESLNHLFMPGEGKSTPEEYSIPSHIPGYVINDIANWILK